MLYLNALQKHLHKTPTKYMLKHLQKTYKSV
nr:MAG TPA: hypothetical protein [Caudoviricetes sp.]